ncbi:hypothetical protein AB205_0058190 [Aquarana catesbeiana]|uniref:Uncharacterized protein n=1 Tax=Aquarana catesbeiana TaxID=8400 RepID=A0A2G9SEI2_AQUCT|nr:hypothetical protein AB205_0058190 [Aquarana catesbeiana]PIO38504.1 hypothetical protein AB205_0058190 [Aquarana catesbeiana]
MTTTMMTMMIMLLQKVLLKIHLRLQILYGRCRNWKMQLQEMQLCIRG